MKHVKLFFALFAMLALGVGNAWGAEATIKFSEKGLENGVQYSDPFTIDANTTITFAGGGNDGKYYNTGTGIRTYGDGTITVECTNGTISEISFTWSGTSYKPAADVASPVGYSTSTDKWTGSASSVTLTRPSGSGHWRLQEVTVTYETAGGGEDPGEGGGETPDPEPEPEPEPEPTTTNWVATDIANISATDVVVVTMSSGNQTWALTSAKGSSSAPTAVVVTVANDGLTEEPADTLKWNISNTDGSLTIYPNGTTATWLYCTNANNGVRVGTNDNKTFTIEGTYLKNTGTSRYVGVYNSQDWRCYTNTTGNTAGQTLKFYKYVEPTSGGETPDPTPDPEEPEEPVVPEGPENLGAKTIAEFLELKNTTDTCVLTGVVANIANTTYGNFDLVDATGSVYVYGLLTAAGESKQFESMDIAAGDTLTVKAIYNEYNSNPQAKNAIYVSHTKAATPIVPENLGAKTIAEFLELKNTTDTCVLTGVVANIANTTYGNFDLVDATGSVYVYGLLTAAGESKQFESMDIAAGDTLTVKAIYNEYNSNPQAKNAIYVSHSKLVLTVEVTSENGTVDGLVDGGKYVRGQEVTLTATAAEGYEFVNWTSGETEVSTENPYTFTVTADVALVANFVAVDYKDITFTVGKSGFTGVPQIKWWGAKGLEDAAEPVEMTAGQYNRYSYTFSNIDAITGVSFYIVLDGVQSKTITLHETPNTYSQFYTILQEVFVTLEGETEGVQLEGHPMAGYSSDYTKVNGVVQLPANTTKAFKLTVDGKDKGGNTIALTKDNLTANFTEDGEGNATIATELAGGYLFTYDYITKDVTVVYPFVGTMDLGQMTPSYSDESVTLKDDNYNEVTIYNVVEGEHTYGENFDIEASVKHNGKWYTLTGKGSWTLADGVMTLVTTNLVDENKTVNYTITATALAPQEYTIACNGTYDEEVTEHYSSIKYAATTDEEDVIVIEIGVYGEETSASGQFNDTWFTTLTYTVAEGEDGVKVLTATATDEAGNTYHITITATKLVYPSINIYNATLVEEEEGDVRLTCTYESVNFTLNYSYAMWAGGYTAELASEDYTVFYSCEAPSLEKDGSNYTITGVFSDENSNKYNVMVTTKANPTTSLDNLNSIVAPVKMIENGQLIIVKDGVQYNAQGAVVK